MTDAKIIDYYKLFDIDRRNSCNEIKKQIREQMNIWQERKVTTKDERKLQIVTVTLEHLTNASMILGFPAKRQAYDQELEAAYKYGQISDSKQVEAKDALEMARKYYNEGKPQLAVHHALQAIENDVGVSDAHEILAHSYYELGQYTEALATVDQANKRYKENINFEWLKIRFCINLERFEEAQKQINLTLQREHYNSLIHAEQAYLYYCVGKQRMALDEIDRYIAQNPNDVEYKQFVANNLITCSQTLYLVDPSMGGLVLTEREAYQECLMLCEKAYSLFSNEATKKELDDVLSFGVTEFDERNKGKLIFIGVETIIAIIAFFSISIIEVKLLALAIAVLLIFFDISLWKASTRPLWAILKESYTGARDPKEAFLIGVADLLCFPLVALRDIF